MFFNILKSELASESLENSMLNACNYFLIQFNFTSIKISAGTKILVLIRDFIKTQTSLTNLFY